MAMILPIYFVAQLLISLLVGSVLAPIGQEDFHKDDVHELRKEIQKKNPIPNPPTIDSTTLKAGLETLEIVFANSARVTLFNCKVKTLIDYIKYTSDVKMEEGLPLTLKKDIIKTLRRNVIADFCKGKLLSIYSNLIGPGASSSLIYKEIDSDQLAKDFLWVQQKCGEYLETTWNTIW